MLLLTAAEIRETTHIVTHGTIAASKLAAGAAANGEADGRGLAAFICYYKSSTAAPL